MDGGIKPLMLLIFYDFMPSNTKKPLDAIFGYILVLCDDDDIPLDDHNINSSSSISFKDSKCSRKNNNDELPIWEP